MYSFQRSFFVRQQSLAYLTKAHTLLLCKELKPKIQNTITKCMKNCKRSKQICSVCPHHRPCTDGAYMNTKIFTLSHEYHPRLVRFFHCTPRVCCSKLDENSKSDPDKNSSKDEGPETTHQDAPGQISLVAEMMLAEEQAKMRRRMRMRRRTSPETDFDELNKLFTDAQIQINYDLMKLQEKMNEEDKLSDEEEIDISDENMKKKEIYRAVGAPAPLVYGSPDPRTPKTRVPCPGCGALLHCQDPERPGYMEPKKFNETPLWKLQSTQCKRCYLMYFHKTCLDVAVSPEDYQKILATVRDIHALVVVVVDVTDLPGSIFPNLGKLIGKRRPLYVVGNKLDLLPADELGHIGRVKANLERICQEQGLVTDNYVKHLSLVSAKTGYGIEELVTKLLTDWSRKGPVYILGCTNVGKSSLFNSMLMSDYCDSLAADHIRRATVSVWPGTTLSLLKFPIIDPTPWRLKKRARRLIKQRSDEVEAELLKKSMHDPGTAGKKELPALKVSINRTNFEKDMTPRVKNERRLHRQMYTTYKYGHDDDMLEESKSVREIQEREGKRDTLDLALFRRSHWCYDTPGVVNPEQIINLLSQSELEKILPRQPLVPRSFSVKPGFTIFVSGLGRIDFIQAAAACCFTVLACKVIPVHILPTEEADSFYRQHVGTEHLGVPLGDSKRLWKVPSLIGQEINLTGVGWRVSIADIVLSSLGWVSVTAGTGMSLQLRAYTPAGLGCRVRQPPLLPYAVNMKGRRVKGTPRYVVKYPKL